MSWGKIKYLGEAKSNPPPSIHPWWSKSNGRTGKNGNKTIFGVGQYTLPYPFGGRGASSRGKAQSAMPPRPLLNGHVPKPDENDIREVRERSLA